jgi:pimeloyl-ACP methyl ester carboxylesterase
MFRVVVSAVLALVFVLATYEAVAERIDMRRFRPPGKLVDVSGHEMHIRCEGSGGPPVVFIAGAGSTSLAWSFVQPEIAKRTRACAYDRRGFAWSEPSTRGATVDASADDLRAVLRAAGEEPPYLLVAHSLGGTIAMHYATAHPDEVAGIVFVDAAYRELYETFLERFPNWSGRLTRAKWMLRAALASAYVGLPRIARIKVGDAKLSEEHRAAANAFGRRPAYFSAVRDEIVGLERSRATALSEPPRDLPVTVLMHGRPKALFGEDEAEALWADMQSKLASRFDDAKHVVVKDAGHFIQLDNPDAVVDAIYDVADRIR